MWKDAKLGRKCGPWARHLYEVIWLHSLTLLNRTVSTVIHTYLLFVWEFSENLFRVCFWKKNSDHAIWYITELIRNDIERVCGGLKFWELIIDGVGGWVGGCIDDGCGWWQGVWIYNACKRTLNKNIHPYYNLRYNPSVPFIRAWF